MDANVKKTALRMIPYGLYVLTAKGKDDTVAAATVNWVTQASFAPPLVAVGVKADSHAHALIKESKAFALNVLGKGQQADGLHLLQAGRARGASDLRRAVPLGHHRGAHPRADARVRGVPARGVGRARRPLGLRRRGGRGGSPAPVEGRADDATLWLKELGPKIFYGG